MAGSHRDSARASLDPILTARLEALQLLADRVSDRVLVVSPDLTIVYANESAWPEYKRAATVRPAKCYEAFLNQLDPCRFCLAKEVFDSGQVRSVSCTTGEDGSACGMHQAFPLMCDGTQPRAVLVLLKHQDGSKAGIQAALTTSCHLPKVAARTSLGPVIGRSTAMQDLFEMIELVADSQATVLLQGESGTGKELVAKTIHRLSPRGDRAFIVVDCGSLPETLLESELFGHVKGAFTGAVTAKKGLLEEADGGTLFLDEIADTTPQFQAKLLRVVQEGEIKPVGSTCAVKVDVRIISATNKDLLASIKTKAFRADLYYRLAVLPLVLPPLRDRRDDIPLLVRHFMEISRRRHRRALRTVTDQAMQALVNAPWPGNVRELQHVIERAVVTSPAEALRETDFFGAAASVERKSDLRASQNGRCTPQNVWASRKRCARRPETRRGRRAFSKSAAPVSIINSARTTSIPDASERTIRLRRLVAAVIGGSQQGLSRRLYDHIPCDAALIVKEPCSG